LRRAQSESIERPFTTFSVVLELLSQFIGLLSSIAIILYWKPWVASIIVIIPIVSTLYMAKMGHLQYKIEFERTEKSRKSWYLNYMMTNDIAFKEIKIYKLGSYFVKGYKELSKGFILQDKTILKKRTTAS